MKPIQKSVHPFRLSRRAMLRGAGGVALGLPWLEAMVNPKNAYAAGPKRFIVFFTPNGTLADRWKPTGAGTSFTLSEMLKPLDPIKNKCVFLDGLLQGNKGSIGGPGDDHMKGMAWMLTGRTLSSGTIPGGGGAPPAGLGTGISIDQQIANSIGGSTKFKSLEFGVHSLTVAGNPLFMMVYTGPNAAVQPQQSPSAMFDRVFGSFTAPSTTPSPMPDPSASRAAADKQSVIDAVKDSFTALEGRVGTEDKARLEDHLAKIRDLEQRLKTTGGGTPGGGTQLSAGCAKPTRPANNDAYSESTFQANGQAHLDLMLMSLTCDLTRVASIQWSYSAGGPTFTWLGHDKGHHDYSHDGDTLADSQNKLAAINNWYAGRFFDLISRMDKIQEGDKTMLDQSLVLWVNELSKGNIHSHGPMCYVLAGGAGGALQTGRYLHVDGGMHNNLLVSCMNMMGVQGNTFGDPSACTGPLTQLNG
jgi:hypothetical protein